MYSTFIFTLAKKLGYCLGNRVILPYELLAWVLELDSCERRLSRLADTRHAKKMGKGCGCTHNDDKGKGDDLEWNSPKWRELDRFGNPDLIHTHKPNHRPAHDVKPRACTKEGFYLFTKAGPRAFTIYSFKLVGWHRSTCKYAFQLDTAVGTRTVYVRYDYSGWCPKAWVDGNVVIGAWATALVLYATSKAVRVNQSISIQNYAKDHPYKPRNYWIC